MKKRILTIKNEDARLFVNQLKENMLQLEKENATIFGDEKLYNKARKFNQLTDWEQNVLALYSYCNSYQKMQEYFNCKRTSIANLINQIKSKVIL